eukprot:scaffold7016_cov123-Isochrysis_galbana.AAC.13
MDAIIGNDSALYTAAWLVGSMACVMLLNRVLATNPKLPKAARPFGVVKDGILWNATTVGVCAGPETVEGASTVHELMELAFTQWSSEPVAGKRPLLKRYYEEIKPGQTVEKLTFADEYVFTTYAQYKKQMAELASGMVAFAKLKPGDKVVIYAETQLEWMLAALAAFTQSLTVVTIYATLGEEGLAHGLSQTKAKLIVADAKLLPKVTKAVTAAGKDMASCKHVVYIGDPVQETDDHAASALKQTLVDLASAPPSRDPLPKHGPDCPCGLGQACLAAVCWPFDVPASPRTSRSLPHAMSAPTPWPCQMWEAADRRRQACQCELIDRPPAAAAVLQAPHCSGQLPTGSSPRHNHHQPALPWSRRKI